jgi:hypothetical protein
VVFTPISSVVGFFIELDCSAWNPTHLTLFLLLPLML